MASDFELDAMLEIDDSQVDEVNNELEADVTGGGDVSPAQKDTQQSVVAGGFRTALKATGLLAILSQLKPITATLGAILGVIGRSLVPVVEALAEFIRPLVQGVNEGIANLPEGEQILDNPAVRATGISSLAELAQGDVEGFAEENVKGSVLGQSSVALANFIGRVTGGGKNNAELSDEADKIQTKQNAEDATRDKTGAFR